VWKVACLLLEQLNKRCLDVIGMELRHNLVETTVGKNVHLFIYHDRKQGNKILLKY
jgi:hypothetical protein